MSSNTRVPKAEITGLYGAIAKRMSRKIIGDVAEPMEVMWHNKKVLNTAMGLGGKVQKWDACPLDLKSYAHMAVSSMIGCTWCLDYAYFETHNKNLDVDKAREVPRWRESDVFTDSRARGDGVCRGDEPDPAHHDRRAGRRACSPSSGRPRWWSCTSFIAFSNFTTRANVALGIESQGFAASCDLKPLAERPARPAVVASS